MQKCSPCTIISFLIKECLISAWRGVWKGQVMMSLVLIFKCLMLISLWLSFQLFVALPKWRCLSWNFPCSLLLQSMLWETFEQFQASGTCRAPAVISCPQKSLWWKRSSSNTQGKANPALIAGSRESQLCSPGTWDGVWVPTDGGRNRLQHLETSTSLCDISWVTNEDYWQWNANGWSISVKNPEVVFTWGNSLWDRSGVWLCFNWCWLRHILKIIPALRVRRGWLASF